MALSPKRRAKIKATTKKTLLLNVAFGIATLLFVWVMGRNFYRKMGFEKNQAARSEMKVLLSRLQLGDSPTQVRGYMANGKFQHLKLDTRHPSLWNVKTPFEFGAKNWSLWLEFDASANLAPQAKVAAIRLRTPDGTNIPPRDVSVPDKVRPGWQSPRADWWQRP